VANPGTQQMQLIPVNLTAQQQQPIKFKAQLASDFMCSGSQGGQVDVELDLFETGTMTVGLQPHTVHLLVGKPLTQAQYKAAVAASKIQQ
jgi:hypothetical protein